MQNDNLQPLLTVQETMHVAADLKLDEADHVKQEAVIILNYWDNKLLWGSF